MTVTLVADHSLLLAIPAFVPAFIVAGVVIFVATKDRRRADDEQADGPHSGRSDQDGTS